MCHLDTSFGNIGVACQFDQPLHCRRSAIRVEPPQGDTNHFSFQNFCHITHSHISEAWYTATQKFSQFCRSSRNFRVERLIESRTCRHLRYKGRHFLMVGLGNLYEITINAGSTKPCSDEFMFTAIDDKKPRFCDLQLQNFETSKYLIK